SDTGRVSSIRFKRRCRAVRRKSVGRLSRQFATGDEDRRPRMDSSLAVTWAGARYSISDAAPKGLNSRLADSTDGVSVGGKEAYLAATCAVVTLGLIVSLSHGA